MAFDTLFIHEENLALRPGVHVTASNYDPAGSGARRPAALINETTNAAT
jgi:hypothetical protein